jgi:hypothetical protein
MREKATAGPATTSVPPAGQLVLAQPSSSLAFAQCARREPLVDTLREHLAGSRPSADSRHSRHGYLSGRKWFAAT